MTSKTRIRRKRKGGTIIPSLIQTPPSSEARAVMSDEDDADCAFLYYVRNAQRCKNRAELLL